MHTALAIAFVRIDSIPLPNKSPTHHFRRDTDSNQALSQLINKYYAQPGEIIFTLYQNWNEEYDDPNSAKFKILSGNVEKAIRYILGSKINIDTLYFTKALIKDHIHPIPKTMVHLKINGGSDAAGLLELGVDEEERLGDGVKVHKRTFYAF